MDTSYVAIECSPAHVPWLSAAQALYAPRAEVARCLLQWDEASYGTVDKTVEATIGFLISHRVEFDVYDGGGPEWGASTNYYRVDDEGNVGHVHELVEHFAGDAVLSEKLLEIASAAEVALDQAAHAEVLGLHTALIAEIVKTATGRPFNQDHDPGTPPMVVTPTPQEPHCNHDLAALTREDTALVCECGARFALLAR